MATSTWLGGYGLFDAPENWDQNSVPGTGDTAAIGSGGALALFESIQATVHRGAGQHRSRRAACSTLRSAR